MKVYALAIGFTWAEKKTKGFLEAVGGYIMTSHPETVNIARYTEPKDWRYDFERIFDLLNMEKPNIEPVMSNKDKAKVAFYKLEVSVTQYDAINALMRSISPLWKENKQ